MGVCQVDTVDFILSLFWWGKCEVTTRGAILHQHWVEECDVYVGGAILPQICWEKVRWPQEVPFYLRFGWRSMR